MARAQRRSPNRGVARRPSSDAREIEKFSALAREWWDADFVRRVTVQQFEKDARTLRPFAELSLVDIGCGGGLLSEPLARQGFRVLGVDAARENIAAAERHLGQTNERLAYRCAHAEDLADERRRFDVVLAMEIVEHVTDRQNFVETCAALVKPGGLLFVATIARTMKALALAKFGAEYLLNWIPRGTHDWNKFVSPHELSGELEHAGLSVREIQGVSFDPLGWRWQLSSDTDVNYMIAAVKPRGRRQRSRINSRR